MKRASITVLLIAGTCTVTAFTAYMLAGRDVIFDSDTELTIEHTWEDGEIPELGGGRVVVATDRGGHVKFTKQRTAPGRPMLERQTLPPGVRNGSSDYEMRSTYGAFEADQAGDSFVKRSPSSAAGNISIRVRSLANSQAMPLARREAAEAVRQDPSSASQAKGAKDAKDHEPMDSDLSEERFAARKAALAKARQEALAANPELASERVAAEQRPRPRQRGNLTPEQALLAAQIGAQNFANVAAQEAIEEGSAE